MSMVTFRVESNNRWDPLALAGKLARYRWYLIEPDACHWHICVPVEQSSHGLPPELRRTIRSWLRERRLENAMIHTDREGYLIAR
jgi:hypothetical protein